jgi:hypothetical protein
LLKSNNKAESKKYSQRSIEEKMKIVPVVFGTESVCLYLKQLLEIPDLVAINPKFSEIRICLIVKKEKG